MSRDQELKPLTANRETHPLYIRYYESFPEIEDIFANILFGHSPLTGITSTHSDVMLEILAEDVLLPALEKEGLIRRGAQGFEPCFSEIHIHPSVFSARQWAHIYKRKYESITNKFSENDTPETLILGNMTLRVPIDSGKQMLKNLKLSFREIIETPHSAEDDAACLHLVVIGRINS